MAKYSAPQYGNVHLVDPGMVNVNENMINSIPQYQDMHIFAELTAQRKGRTVLAINSQGTSIQDNGMNSDMVVNFMGNNQDTENPNPNFGKFTTNYYDGSTGDRTHFEGFGISNIKVVINSSYIPQVNIEFVDVRGLAFFNQEKSPYRILFDFPPPVFCLTLKGYYGLALEYKLHLVKYTSEFKSENGNYIINAQFVAVTFAPLSDVLFRYVVNFPLINNPVLSNPSPSEEPKNTYELILKIKSLYAQYNEKKNTTPDTEAYNFTVQQLGKNTDVMGILPVYHNDSTLLSYSKPLMFIKNNATQEDGLNPLTLITSPSEYDDYLKTYPTDGIPENLTKRLIVALLVNKNVPTSTIPSSEGTWEADEILDKYAKSELFGRANAVLGPLINETDIQPAEMLTNKITVDDAEANDVYSYIDVTRYYVKLYKQRADLIKKKTESMSIINEKINDLVLDSLGMKPTIYNIFKILLNDVDKFFNILRNTSIDAENHHTLYADKIITDNNFRDITTNRVNNIPHIFSWPLVVKQEKICNQIKESRTVPIELSEKVKAQTNQPFPEIGLIKSFIETFSKQQKVTEQLNMRAEQNADGTYKWIPISPVDSKLATADLSSPYMGLDNTDGGSQSQPIDLSSDPKLVQVFRKLMERFYILSQSSFADSFYLNGIGNSAVADMFAESESINLAVSITNTEFTKLLGTAAKRYGTEGNIQEFYNYMKVHMPEMVNFTELEQPSFRISNGDTVYTNKKNPRYYGFELYSDSIATHLDGAGDSDNPITKFQKEVNLNFWKKLKNMGPVTESFYQFTEENVFYIKDGTSDGTTTKSRFIASPMVAFITEPENKNPEDYELRFTNISSNDISEQVGQTTYNREEIIDILSTQGNSGFTNIGVVVSPKADDLKAVGDIVETWTDQLSLFDTQIFDKIINGYGDEPNPDFDARLSALILLSNFGYSLSPFTNFPYGLNGYIFHTPAAVEIPNYLPAYMGALIDMSEEDLNNLKNFFSTGAGKNLDSSGAFIFADLVDINKFLSVTDKATLKSRFTAFYGNGGTDTPFHSTILYLKELYAGAQKAYQDADSKKDKAKKKFYEDSLSPNGSYYTKLLEPLISKITLLNFGQLTFKRQIDTPVGFSSLETTNSFTFKKDVNDKFFKKFFTQLSLEIIKQQNKIITQDQENTKLSGDDDILTQCYYSFKNINDKWLSGPLNTKSNDTDAGYPFGETTMTNKKLIDSFVFVDRAMNPIGDTIINPEILINMLDNPNVSIFSVISQILSMNGFEFFPLQNFLKFQEGQWEESFMIDNSNTIKTGPTFVCMYIGGGSSYPSGIGLFNQFVDDGIIDLSNNTAKDFSTNMAEKDADGNPISNGCYTVPSEDNQTAKNPEFPFGQVRAFRVRFGEQNQSMFKDIKIDSKDYPETNESLQILSRLAGDNKLQAPPAKGQNLYNLYENRSYKATVMGLGNVMIQPTQYFQLENVPLFNGAYIILSVEHSVEPNKMTTSFSGMKILQYPVPRVLQSSAIMGFEGGNTDETNPAMSSAEEVTIGVGTAGNPDLTKFNSMYDFKIQ